MIGQLALREISRSIDRFQALQPSQELRDFVAGLPENQISHNPERRRYPRYPLVADVMVIPIDADFRPIAAPFIACTRNISTGGICFYHCSRAPSEFLYLELDDEGLPPMQAVMTILRQTPVDRFWEIAGQFYETNET
jgi:hypothetical protein